MKVELISWTKNPIDTIAKAASTCYRSEPNIEIIKKCIKSGHFSVLEFINFVFKIEGIDRSTSHQLVRHRIASYAQESQRYVNMSDMQCNYPSKMTDEQFDIMSDTFGFIQEGYDKLIQSGMKKEDARSVLPNACQTTICVSMNLRALTHFMNERLCTRAQYSIREMAKAMIEAIRIKQNDMELNNEELDLILSLFIPKCEAGEIKFCPEHKSCGRQKTAKEINTILAKNIESKWIDDGGCLICSNCKTAYSMPFTGSNYCPNCGQKMGNIIKE